MKSEFDKEIDWLLRGHTREARRGGASSAHDAAMHAAGERGNGHESARAPAGSSSAAAHLDADELAAYAENALPPATRMRYVAHLADCDECRKIATGIALAGGVAVELEKNHQAATGMIPASSNWREWLASLLSPRALRYAAPVLALLVVGVVAFIALREQSGNLLVADRRATDGGASAPMQTTDEAATQAQQPAGSQTSSVANANANVAASATSDTGMSGEASLDGSAPSRNKEADPANAAPTVFPDAANVPPPPAGSAAQTRMEGAGANTMTVESLEAAKARRDEMENRAAAPPPAAPKAVSNEAADANDALNVQSEIRSGRERDESSTATRASGGAGQSRAAGGGKNEDFNQQSEPLSRAQRSQAPQRMTARRAAERTTAPPADAEEAGPAVEMRNVGGRRFRRQGGGAWIDTAYRSSQATVQLRRGSEQFRALVADEPELRRIADQLGGEVVVVWRGRAYRIR